MMRNRHPLVLSLLALRGNARACVYVEPLWGIAYNLYAPFATLYMARLSLSDSQIGLLLTIGMIMQIITSLLGSVLIDKMGRRRSALLLGLLSWSVPPLVLMLSQNFWWFLVATLFGGIGMIESVAWNCLLVEDAEPDKLVDMYHWTTISGLLSVFFAPLAGLMVRSLTLVTAMRILYGFAFVMMSIKTILLFYLSRETRQGKRRMQETKDRTYKQLLGEYRQVLGRVLKTPATLQIIAIVVLIHITNLISTNFFALFATQKVGVPDWLIALFPMARSAIMLIFFFGVQHRVARYPMVRVMLSGLCVYLVTLIFLLLAPLAGLAMLFIYIVLDAAAFALVWPRRNSLLALNIEPQERARIVGVIYALMIAIASPFGWLAGWLSERNRAFPFVLSFVLYLICLIALRSSKAISEAQSGNGPQVAGTS
ncbi:MAG: MFS transporter [Ruminococcaceae bacterium]|nr:MFS transporter [Oscillospiraceae bacterium]